MLKALITNILIICTFATNAQQPVLKSESVQRSAPILVPGLSVASPEKAIETNGSVKRMKSFSNDLETVEHEVVIVQKSKAPVGLDISTMPLFGGYQKSEVELKADNAFIEDCNRNFDSREEAVEFFTKMGWDYLSEGSKEMAINRFNLAWLLKKDNVDVYWGLGVIEYQKGEYENSIELMRRGLEIDRYDNVTLLVDLATVYIKCFINKKRPSDLSNAYELLDKAIEIAPEFTNSYMQLALANLSNDQIDEAWITFHKGYELDPGGINTDILSALLNTKPDPKGIFSKR